MTVAALLGALAEEDYDFVTITPASHARVAARWQGLGEGLRDLFGWSRSVHPASIPEKVRKSALSAGILVSRNGGIASTLRISKIHHHLFAHSAWPTDPDDSVFLGPDSYRFASLIRRVLHATPPPATIVDIGAGAGVGAIIAADHAPGAHIVLTDINPAALNLLKTNAKAAGVTVHAVQTDGLTGVSGAFDLALLNPPYLVDACERSYRHGGDQLGTALPLALSTQAMQHLAPGGRLAMYSGSPIVRGEDNFHRALAAVASAAGCTLDYEELDPDVFGEELDRACYGEADRIALIAAIATRLR